MMPSTKRSTSFRLTDEARRLLEALAAQLGISQSSVIELALREKARKLGIP